MIRLETIRKFRCPFGICIAFSILAVIGCDFFCKLDLISFSFPKPQTVAASSAHTHEGAHHGEKDHHHDHGTAANHEASEEGGCCNSLTQQFYSSLFNTANAQIDLVHAEVFKLISVFVQSDFIEQNLLSSLLSTSQFDHKPNGPPGITGHYIRILFSSFLI